MGRNIVLIVASVIVVITSLTAVQSASLFGQLSRASWTHLAILGLLGSLALIAVLIRELLVARRLSHSNNHDSIRGAKHQGGAFEISPTNPGEPAPLSPLSSLSLLRWFRLIDPDCFLVAIGPSLVAEHPARSLKPR